METMKKVIKKVSQYEHSFYCDECGEYLGTSQEYEDGRYKVIGEFELSFYAGNEWYRIKKHLCDDCRKSFINNIKVNLTNLGFRKDK